MASLAWNSLLFTLRKNHSQVTLVHQAYMAPRKSLLSPILYAMTTILSFFHPMVAVASYLLVAIQ
jgi:hypothetical protein